MTLQSTVLLPEHQALNAKLVDFGGWQMPLNYGSQIEEHAAVRGDAGMFDVSHMCPVDVNGSGAKAFLQKLIANDVDKLKTPGKALYSCMLNETGGVIDDLIVYWLGGERYRVVVNASTAPKDLAHMQAVAAGFAVQVNARRDLAMIAVQGPQAKAKTWQARPAWQAATETLKPFFAAELGETIIASTGYTGEDGFEIMLPASEAAALWRDLIAAGVKPCGLAARDTLRLEAGMALYGNEMNESVNPLDAGLGWTIDLKNAERDFIGRAAVSGQPKQQFLGLKLTDKGVLRGHMTVQTPQGAGETTSGTFSPSLGCGIALARLPLGVAVGDTVQVDMRGKWVDVTVTKPNFVRHGKPV